MASEYNSSYEDTISARDSIPVMSEAVTTGRGINGFSYSGYNFHDASSALQKAVRRGYVNEAIFWGIQMFLANPGACRTNAWNRALVMSIEDVGVANPDLISRIYDARYNHHDNLYMFGSCIEELAKSPKCRINDWALHHYPDLVHMKQSDANAAIDRLCPPIYVSDEQKVNYMRELLISVIKAKNLELSIKYSLILYHTSYEAPYKGKRKSYHHMWAAIGLTIDSPYVIRLIELATSTNWGGKGSALLIMSHIFICNALGKLPKAIPTSVIICNNLLKPFIDKIAANDASIMIGIPDHAYDKHTGKGVRMGRGMQHFADVGSYLNNVPSWLKNKEARFKRVFMEINGLKC